MLMLTIEHSSHRLHSVPLYELLSTVHMFNLPECLDFTSNVIYFSVILYYSPIPLFLPFQSVSHHRFTSIYSQTTTSLPPISMCFPPAQNNQLHNITGSLPKLLLVLSTGILPLPELFPFIFAEPFICPLIFHC